MSNYTSADSPRGGGDAERYNRLVQDTTASIQSFHQTTRAIMQKMLILGTPQDNRANHQELKEMTDKGNTLVAKINKRLQELYKFTQSGAQARTRKTQVNKLSSDFKNQCKNFEDTCKKLVEAEKAAIAHIRQSSHSFRREDDNNVELGNYNEDKLYAQANVTTYDEDDLLRREQDLIHINHQVREVNAAFKEVDDLVTDQGEVVVEIEENTNAARENVEGALDNVREADAKKGYCVCSKTKLICYGLFTLVVAILVLSLVLGLK
uniref:t-SNARE coiled-coil homology domain-containing protein n=1 Tax=Globisporangium ultimum (strain ATCC 200006 / CBS 805.95 / DAOM BR144) TaxID=431595 RepID=K3WAE6_GLOUD